MPVATPRALHGQADDRDAMAFFVDHRQHAHIRGEQRNAAITASDRVLMLFDRTYFVELAPQMIGGLGSGAEAGFDPHRFDGRIG